MISLFTIERERRFGVLALGKLAPGVSVQLLDRTIVAVFRQTEAENLKQLDMNGKRGKPFLAADH